MHNLIVIGGGAAGLWGALVAAGRGLRVLVLDKNIKPGVKILISGGTRCNITHHCGPEAIVTAFGSQGRFLKPSVYALPPSQVVAQFNSWGVATKVEDTGKVFPASDRALHVRDALVNQLKRAGAELRTGVAVCDIRPGTHGTRWEVVTDCQSIPCHSVLLCTGGLSFSACGTTGDGYRWARNLGHTVTQTHPALAPLVSPANWVHELTGITLPDVIVRVPPPDKKDKDSRRASRSSFLWTHFGCSGPAPMNVSRYISQAETARAADPSLPRSTIEVDLLPDLSEQDLQSVLDPAKNGHRRVSSIIADWLPSKLVDLLLANAQVAPTCVVAELSRKSRISLLSDLKRLPVPVDSTRGYSKAEVTSGGVHTKEVDPHTLESRLHAGLYFAGEILDVDGPIGGYNFQAAFATANAAALNAPRISTAP